MCTFLSCIPIFIPGLVIAPASSCGFCPVFCLISSTVSNMVGGYSRSVLPRTGLAPLLASLDLPGEIQLPCGAIHSIGSGQPNYRVIFRSKKALRTPMTELSIAEAFVRGDIDVEGDIGVLFGAREQVQDRMPLQQKIQFLYDFARTTTTMNAKAVGEHYSRGDDFYLTFIDKRFRFYSHGLFQRPDESIEEAGMRLLDIGGGWGGVTQYCGARGIHVTTLTIAKDSQKFISRLIEEQKLPGEVFLEDFLNHKPAEPYDHAVMYGVIEHIPNYRRFARSVWRVLKPGGRLYLDGSADDPPRCSC